MVGGLSSSEMVRSIGELERGSELASGPFTACEKKLEIIGCLIPALPLFLVLDSGCRIAVSDDLHSTLGDNGEVTKELNDASGGFASAAPRDAMNRAIRHLKLQYSIINNKVRRHVHTQVIPGNVRLVCFRLPLTVSHNSSMTRATRRTTRHSTSQLLGSDAAASVPPDAETDIVDSHEDLCPSCSVSLARDAKDEHSESWVRCDFCKTWYHWRCVGENGQLDTIDKWFVPLLSYFLCHLFILFQVMRPV